jgi:neutral trehalase
MGQNHDEWEFGFRDVDALDHDTKLLGQMRDCYVDKIKYVITKWLVRQNLGHYLSYLSLSQMPNFANSSEKVVYSYTQFRHSSQTLLRGTLSLVSMKLTFRVYHHLQAEQA